MKRLRLPRIGVLIAMDATCKLTDLLPINDIQKMQDSFADAIGFTAVIVDQDGCSVTYPSNWGGFCEFFYCSETWSSDCHFDRLQMLAQSRRTMRTALSLCPHTGFSTAAIPITFDGKYLASWAVGQIRIKELAGTDSIADIAGSLSSRMRISESEASRMLDRLPVMSMADFRRISNFIQTFSESALNHEQIAADVRKVSGPPAPGAGAGEPRRRGGGHMIDNLVKVYASSKKPFDLRGKCLSIILSAHDADGAFYDVLETVGRSFGVNRAFILVNAEGTAFMNRYEWCDSVPEPHRRTPVNVSARRLSQGMSSRFRRDGMILSSDASGIGGELYEVLEDRQIKSAALFPIWDGDDLIGFVGCAHNRERTWTPGEMTMLWNLGMIVASRVRKHSSPHRIDRTKHALLDLLGDTMERFVKGIS
ncbi:MAG: PocR ligand-binding domain-containing protein [Synergistaceae bacterium]|jgi:ligand-binding sensor protein|nr:PocR ligand-binding domain-containing protein [Synergistaceae bacterium]